MTLFSCQKNESLIFDSKPGLYFGFEDDVDSLTFSMLGSITDRDTVRIPLKIMGNAINYDGKFKLEVVESATTAQVGKHYTALSNSYIFEAGIFVKDFELEVFKSDPDLEKESKSITLKIIESEDFGIGYTKNSIIKIMITNQIVKPVYWDMPLALYFGAYSKVKHNLIINILGHDFPLTLDQAINPPYSFSYWMVGGRAVCQYVIENDVYDENNNKIMPWVTF